MKRPWNLAELSYEDVRTKNIAQLAILPLGATEPHNLHLPYGTDTLQVEKIADLAASKAHAKGASVVVLPCLPYGTETNLSRFPLAMNLNPTTVAAIINDLVASLAKCEIHKLLLLNGHGGNDLKWILRQMHGSTPVHIFLCNWYKMAVDQHKAIFDDAGDHAGELETSMGLAHFSHLVDLPQADAGSMAPSRFNAVRKGWVEITRPWHLLTTNTGAGDPRPASAEKGHALTEIVVDRLASFLIELSASSLDDRFPFEAEGASK